MKNKFITVLLGLIFVSSTSLLIYNYFYNNAETNGAKQKVVKKISDKTTKKNESEKVEYDFLSLESFNSSDVNVDNDTLNLKVNDNKKDDVYLVDVYSGEVVKKYQLNNQQLKIKFSDVSNLKSRYDVLVNDNNHLKKILLNSDSNLQIKDGFGIISNQGFELSINKIYVDYDKEADLFYNDLNNYRFSIGKSKLKRDKKIDNLSKIRTKDEVEERKYNFHYSKSTGYSNIALLNAGIVSSSNCGSQVSNLEANKYCDFKYQDKNWNVNLHNNDFEQITRGLIFAHENLDALKKSPIHNQDLISGQKTTIGIAFYGDFDQSKLNQEEIIMYGPTQDHNEEQAASGYINNNFASGLKKPEDQDKVKVKWLNVAISLYML